LTFPSQKLRNCDSFHVSPSLKNCSSTRHDISVRTDFDVFRKQIITFSHIFTYFSILDKIF
jgi:hypothetical protein